jgi:hypothetical protein
LDISVIIDNIISAQSGCLDVYTLCCNIQNAVNAEIEKLKEDIAQVEKQPGPKGDPGESIKGDPGESIKGEQGDPGYTPVKGVDYFDGKDAQPIEVLIIDEDHISINGVVITLPRGKAGKNAPIQKRVAGMGSGWAGGGGIQGLKGDQGERGADGAGVSIQSAETDDDVSQGQAIFIHYSGHAKLACSNSGSTLAVGLAYDAAAPGHSLQYLTAGTITQSDWTNVVGTASLTIGRYFLDPNTPGRLTQNCPDSVGLNVQCVGNALSTENFNIEFGNAILL